MENIFSSWLIVYRGIKKFWHYHNNHPCLQCQHRDRNISKELLSLLSNIWRGIFLCLDEISFPFDSEDLRRTWLASDLHYTLLGLICYSLQTKMHREIWSLLKYSFVGCFRLTLFLYMSSPLHHSICLSIIVNVSPLETGDCVKITSKCPWPILSTAVSIKHVFLDFLEILKRLLRNV